jgi:hypothetical protein
MIDPYKIIKKILGSSYRTTNISSLGRSIGASPQRMYYHWHGKTVWPADLWLKTIENIGNLEISDDKIIIYLHK